MHKMIFFIATITFISFSFLHFVLPSNLDSTANLNSDNNIVQTFSDSIYYKTIKTENGWGYDIYLNGKLYVHQPNIPAVSGNNGFVSEEYAAKVAEFVIEKIRKHILPPTVSVFELDSLKVLN
jgi:hypothetical protein